MTLYLRELNTDKLLVNQSLKISPFIPSGMTGIIKNKVPDKNYIIGVRYGTGECQICISGHVKKNETIGEGFIRELSEELYLKPKNDVKHINSKNDNYFYCLHMDSLDVTNKHIENDDIDLKDRAVICVHGGEKSILNYLCKLEVKTSNNDDIDAVWAGPKKKILSIINEITEQGGKYYINSNQ